MKRNTKYYVKDSPTYQLAVIPVESLRITQGDMEGTHKNAYAIDNASGSKVYAPFDCKLVYQGSLSTGNMCVFESLQEVLTKKGWYKVRLMCVHDGNTAGQYVGAVFEQGQQIYEEGTAGVGSGKHVHLSVGIAYGAEIIQTKATLTYNGRRLTTLGLKDDVAIDELLYANDTEIISGVGNWSIYEEVL